MPASFFDMSVSITPPGGYVEPLPILLGPNWQPNDIRLVFASASSNGNGETSVMTNMNPDPPAGFSTAYSINPGNETHGVYWQRLAPGDVDASVYWVKPAGWTHFLMSMLTVRGISPTSTPTGGSLNGITHFGSDAFATVPSVSVPGPGVMVFCICSVNNPTGGWPSWAVSMGVPTGWDNLVATDKAGLNFYAYGTDPSVVVFAKVFNAAGSTGSVVVPTAQGGPAFAGLWAFLTPATDVTGVLGAA